MNFGKFNFVNDLEDEDKKCGCSGFSSKRHKRSHKKTKARRSRRYSCHVKSTRLSHYHRKAHKRSRCRKYRS